jgi:ribosomal protein L37AE/L43A
MERVEMEKHTFYIQPDSDNEEQMKNVAGLLEALHVNYGVKYEAVMRVETDKDFLVPMLEKLQLTEDMPKQAAPEQVTIAKKTAAPKSEPRIVACLNCGKEFEQKRKDNWTCSKECYKTAKRKGYKPPRAYINSQENQDAAERNRTIEDQRIDAVVAKAKDTAPGASFEHRVNAGGAIMARKL